MLAHNPLYDLTDLPLFQEIRAEHIVPAMEQLLADARAALRAAVNASVCHWDSIVAPLEGCCDRLLHAWNIVTHLVAVADSAEIRKARNLVLPMLSGFDTELSQSTALWQRYKELSESEGFAHYSRARRRVVKNALLKFRLAGVDLPEESRQRIASLRLQLSELSAQCDQHLADATNSFSLHIDDEARIAGLPAGVKEAARLRSEREGTGRGWTLSLQTPCVWGVLNHVRDRALREAMYRAFTTRCSEEGAGELSNADTVTRILQLRAEIADVLGFESYAQLAMVDRMLGDPPLALSFLRGLAARARPTAIAEREAMQEYARSHFDIETLQPWDAAFVGERMKESIYGFSAEEVRAYFPEHAVVAGLFKLLREIFGVVCRPGTSQVWHRDVRHIKLEDESGELIGDLYLDLHARPNKRGGAWVAECRSRRRLGFQLQTPVVFLCCNVERGDEEVEALFSHEDIVSLFHEVGHCLHYLTTSVDEVAVSGLNGVEWDAVELPSQLMENFAWEWSVLSQMSANGGSGEPIDRQLFERLLAARNFQYGLTIMRQIEFGLIDLQLHTNPPRNWTQAQDVVADVKAEIGLFPVPPYHRFLASFSHILSGGYAAGYYTYLWSEVLSADAYSAFREKPEEVANTGKRFREEVLSMGGSRPMLEGFQAFRGRAPDSAAMLRDRGLHMA